MATFSKTGSLSLLSLQSVAASSVVVGSAVDVSTKMGGLIAVRFGRRSASSGTAGMNLRLEWSPDSSGSRWTLITTLTTAFAAVESEAVSGTVNSGTNVITVASTTNLSAGVVVFIDNSTIANSEWGRIKSAVTNTSITLEENLVNAQTGSTIYAGAEIYSGVQFPEGALRIRAVADGALFTQAFAIEVIYSTIDGIA